MLSFFHSRLVVWFYLLAAWMFGCGAGVTLSRHLLTACHVNGAHVRIRRPTPSHRQLNEQQEHQNDNELAKLLHRLNGYDRCLVRVEGLEKVT